MENQIRRKYCNRLRTNVLKMWHEIGIALIPGISKTPEKTKTIYLVKVLPVCI